MEKNESFKTELETQYAILIKSKEKKEKQMFIILTCILAITMTFVIISCIFSYNAYKSTKEIKSTSNSSQKIKYRTLSTIFNNGYSLNLSGIGNGYTLANPKVIQITNEGDSDLIYNIKMTNIQTSLLSTNNLVYTISTDGDTSIRKELPLTDIIIVADKNIKPNETQTFVINVAFEGIMEVDNYSNYYNSNIVIEQNDNQTSLLE